MACCKSNSKLMQKETFKYLSNCSSVMKQKKQISKESMQRVMQLFTSLSDETRLKILLSLVDGEMKVNDIYEYVGKENMTLSAISHQLKMLNDLNLVVRERKGKEIFYKLSEDFCWCILRNAFQHYHEGTKCKACMKLKMEEVKK
jgi:ArsR family transcriptional regulator